MTKYQNTFLTEQFIDKVRFVQRLDEIISYSSGHFPEFRQWTFEYIQFTCDFVNNLYIDNNHKYEPLHVLDHINETSDFMIKLNLAYLNEHHIKETYNLNQVRIYTNAVNNVMLAFIDILQDWRGILSYHHEESVSGAPGCQRIDISRISPW